MTTKSVIKSHFSPGHHAVKVVTKHRLAEGSHSNVFPEHVAGSQSHWHGGPRNGHTGAHTVTSKGRK